MFEIVEMLKLLQLALVGDEDRLVDDDFDEVDDDENSFKFFDKLKYEFDLSMMLSKIRSASMIAFYSL